MTPTIARSSRHTRASHRRTDAAPKTQRIEELIAQLITQLERSLQSRQRQAGNNGPEEVLNVEIHGTRYTLLRSPADLPPAEITLSPREQEIARLVASGMSNKTIALVLDISAWTVSTHLRRVFAKLEVNSRAEMVARVLKDGLLQTQHRTQAALT